MKVTMTALTFLTVDLFQISLYLWLLTSQLQEVTLLLMLQRGRQSPRRLIIVYYLIRYLPSKGHQSTPRGWHIGRQWAWRDRSCRSWWCRSLGLPRNSLHTWAGFFVALVVCRRIVWGSIFVYHFRLHIGHLEKKKSNRLILVLSIKEASYYGAFAHFQLQKAVFG